MAIDHLIFNKTNFAPYNNNQQAMILPKQLVLPAQIKVYRKPAIDRTNVFFAVSKAGDTVNVVGKMNDYYLVQGHISGNGTSAGDFSDDVGSILMSDIQNGGVLHSLLVHVYRAVSRFRKEISMVDHLLFDRSKWIKDLVGTSVTVPTNINLYKSYGDDVKKIKSYTGKNTVCRVLAKRIYCAVEIDGQTYYIKPQDLIGGVLRRLKSLLYQWKQVVVC